ncbi:membrane protein insertase YidC [Deltaproteobacteria bacterium TL4]
MENRTFIAVAISFVILLGWSLLFPPSPPPKPNPKLAEVLKTEEIGAEQTLQESTALSVANTNVPQSSIEVDLPAKDLTVDTNDYHMVLDSRGAIVRSFQLKKYNHTKPRTTLVKWFPFLGSIFSNEPIPETQDNLVQLINNQIEGIQSFSLEFEDNLQTSVDFKQTVFSSNQEQIVLQPGNEPATLILTSPVVNHLQVIKTFTFSPDSYVINYQIQIINRSLTLQALKIRQIFGEGRVLDAPSQYAHNGVVYLTEGDLETEDNKKLQTEKKVSKIKWIGIEDPYFITAVAPLDHIRHAHFQTVRIVDGKNELWVPYFGIRLPSVELESNKQVQASFQIYYGPKEDTQMLKFGRDLHRSHKMTLEMVARPLLVLLRWIQSYVGNYGVAIIILTVIVRLTLFPLTYKGMKSMKRMQQLQPKMKRIQEKYKNDKEKLNLELLDLYRKHKVNPIGGCLPMLLQIPIFFGLYSALSTAVELRHTPFYFWLTDLSAPDGLGITPLLMGATMMLQQKMTPTTLMDPTQAKIMQMLPLIFTVFTFSFPSGLLLYWVTSNILSIGQQYLINQIKTPDMDN